MDEGWKQVNNQKKRLTKSQIEKHRLSEEAMKITLDHYYNDTKMPLPTKKEEKKPETLTKNKTSEEVADRETTGSRKIPFEKRQKLIQLREKKGLTRVQVAKLVQQTHSVIDGLENAKGVYDPNLYNKIIQQLNKLTDKLDETKSQ